MWCYRHLLVSLFALTLAAPTVAGIEVGGTRLIFDASKKEATLSVKNPDKNTPYLIQTWLDNGDDADQTKIPFIITPPLFRLDAGQENQLRVINTAPMPQDRETIYWLSVKSIAATTREANQLQISVRTRIKMIYRPAALRVGAGDAYTKLGVKRINNTLVFNNPTPYYISLHTVYLGKSEITEAGMVPPLGSHTLTVPASSSGPISWRAINDYGGRTDAATAGSR
ncbi:fimbrial biogenesis chaperone [Pantoea endophytica]